MLLLAVASIAVAYDDQSVQNCQKSSDVEITACRNKIEENQALTPAQKQMLEMRLSRFGFIQSILEQAKQEQISKVDTSGSAGECEDCDKCKENSDQSQ
jgi:hypothetical protein